MIFELRGVNLPISDALRAHVRRKLDSAVRRFEGRIERLTVWLVDLNGPKGGVDKRCRIQARLLPSGLVVVDAVDADAYAAVSQAALRFEERVVRAGTRRRTSARAGRAIALRRRHASTHAERIGEVTAGPAERARGDT